MELPDSFFGVFEEVAGGVSFGCEQRESLTLQVGGCAGADEVEVKTKASDRPIDGARLQLRRSANFFRGLVSFFCCFSFVAFRISFDIGSAAPLSVSYPAIVLPTLLRTR